MEVSSTVEKSLKPIDNVSICVNIIVICRPDERSKKSMFSSPMKDLFLPKFMIPKQANIARVKEMIMEKCVDSKILNDELVIVNFGQVLKDDVIIQDSGLEENAMVAVYRKKRSQHLEITPVGKTVHSGRSANAISSQASASSMAQRLADRLMMAGTMLGRRDSSGVEVSINSSESLNQLFQALIQPRNRDPIDIPSVASQLHRLVTPELLSPLLEMGFADHVCAKALLLNVLNIELAAQWLISNLDDEQFEIPLSDSQLQEATRNILRTNSSLLNPILPPRPAPASLPAVPEGVQRCLDQNLCTFVHTGQQFAPQPYFMCYDCGLVNGQGCCESCARVCHAGHRLSERISSESFFCDCGYARPAQCQCLVPNSNAASNPSGLIEPEVSVPEEDRNLNSQQLLQNIANMLMELGGDNIEEGDNMDDEDDFDNDHDNS